MQTTSLVLVRHAESEIPRPDGPDDHRRPLTKTGMAQAKLLIAPLIDLAATVIASSPYLRAIQTVEPFARAMGLPIRTDSLLREWDSGLDPTPDYARHYAESWADPGFARPGAESLHQLTERATSVLTALAAEHPGETVVVASHGTFISRALTCFGVTTVDWPFSHAMPMPATYRLDFTATRVHATGPGM